MPSSSLGELETARFAFLSYVETDKDQAGRGAVLITDRATKPLEFRCTTPIRPNAVQRTLYGETLRPYIAVELVGRQLLDAVQEKPSVVIVRDDAFLELRLKTPFHLVCLRRQGEGFSGEDADQQNLLACESGRFQPLIVTTHWKHSTELPAILDFLRHVFSAVDLLEPFDRIEKAIAEIERQPGAH